ncbi:MAG TPA: trehalase-like domain-containing protein, partial [Solirubrobacteraceae bacterium]|nr:trehalase-like domain-containing protein [Solirubrobacteraceae bacterium]
MSPTIPIPPHDAPLSGSSPFPAIADYSFLSDCHTCALMAPDGSIEWMGVPRFDSPSIFGSLLDRRAGAFRVGPYGLFVPLSVRYVPGTMIVETTWLCPSGWLVVRDGLTIGPWHDDHADESSHTRPPTDHDADHMLVRCVECVQGSVQVEVVCEPIFDYGREPAQWQATGSDWSTAEATCSLEDVRLRLHSDMRLGIEGSRARARHTLVEGERRYVAIGWAHGLEGPADLQDAEERMVATEHYWREWLAGGRFPDHRWRSHLHRSALTLKGLTYAPTGATVAAATTSLPETPQGERNWDYRYCWMRDATFTLWGLHALGFDWEADDFMQFVADLKRNEDGALQIMYGIGGERNLKESTLRHLK